MIRVHGHPPIQKTFKRLTDAKSWAQETELSLHRDEYRTGAQESKKRTLGDVIERYREEILPHKAINSQRIESTYTRFWLKELGEYSLSFLSPDIIRKKIALLIGAGNSRFQLNESERPPKPKSRKTVKLYRENLEIMLKHAQK